MAVENPQNKRTAIIVGATGLSGGSLLDFLLNDARYGKVVTLSRKQIPQQHPKLEQHLADLLDPSTYEDKLKGDHLFICTGTTQSKTPDPADYYRIEHDLPVLVASIARNNQVTKVIAISALGASPDSRFMYNRGKGEMERDIEKLNFPEVYFVQPALIGGEREEKRSFESAWKKFQNFIDPLMVGFLKKYRIIHPYSIAKSMIELALNGHETSRIESETLKELAAKYDRAS
jgi:uncharacterized protein YbjT (DUF2867 family)